MALHLAYTQTRPHRFNLHEPDARPTEESRAVADLEMKHKAFSPFWVPVWGFLTVILTGSLILQLPGCLADPAQDFKWIDSLFTAVSAVCVTGLIVVDTGSFFSQTGQAVILLLIQLGGLGIMTYTSLALFLMGRKVVLTNRIAVGQTLLHDPSFSLKRFLGRVIVGTLLVEAVGAALLWLFDPAGFSLWSALFHSVSAFCNAGFSLQADSLTRWRGDWGVASIFMVLITLGGLGFAVLNECSNQVSRYFSQRKRKMGRMPFSWRTKTVLVTSLVLVLGGTAFIFASEWAGGDSTMHWNEMLLVSLFQSVSCRTAGFNTVDLNHLTNLSLLFMIGLMFIGGSPGSTAGGIKTTTVRVLCGYVVAQFRGRSQVLVGGRAVSHSSRSKAVTLFVSALGLIMLATMVLEMSEGGDLPHFMVRGQFMETLFEMVSALGTVGLSMGLTAGFTSVGKVTTILLMFVGRIGPIWLLAGLQSWQSEPRYRLPEDDIPLG